MRFISRARLLIAAGIVVGASFIMPFSDTPHAPVTVEAQALILQAIPVPFLPIWYCSGTCEQGSCCVIGPI